MALYKVVLSGSTLGGTHPIEFSGSTTSQHLIYLLQYTTTTTTPAPTTTTTTAPTTTTTTTIMPDCALECIIICPTTTTTTTIIEPTTTTTTAIGPTTTTTTTCSGGGYYFCGYYCMWYDCDPGCMSCEPPGPTTTTTTNNLTTTTTTTPIQLRIMSATPNCSNSTLTITVEGGTPPYRYSIDNGETLTNPTYSTSYVFTTTNSVYNPYVQDIYNIYRWEELNCNELITVRFETVYLTQYASGQIYDENLVPTTTSFTVQRVKGTIYNASASSVGGSTFLGWTYSNGNKPTKSQTNQIVYETKLNNRVQVFDLDITIYAVFDKSGPISLNFCYFPLSSGYVVTPTDLEFYCANCPQITTVYFNETQYNLYGYQNIIWYKDVNLSNRVDVGDYKLQGAINTTIYRLINGVSTVDGTCPPGGSKLSCC